MLSDKGALVVSLAGEITWQNAENLRERLLALVQQGHRSLVLNLECVSYADSSGLSVFLSISRKLRALNGTFLLINVSDPLVRALRQTRLCDFIPVVAREATQGSTVALPPEEAPVSVRTIGVPCDPTYLGETRRAVAEMFTSLSLSRETVYDLVLALGEALGNAFDHGSGAGEGDVVTVSVSIYKDRVVMEVCDSGAGCAFRVGDELPMPSDTRGRGIRLMLMLADSIEIGPNRAGCGTCVRLVKMIDAYSGDLQAFRPMGALGG